MTEIRIDLQAKGAFDALRLFVETAAELKLADDSMVKYNVGSLRSLFEQLEAVERVVRAFEPIPAKVEHSVYVGTVEQMKADLLYIGRLTREALNSFPATTSSAPEESDGHSGDARPVAEAEERGGSFPASEQETWERIVEHNVSSPASVPAVDTTGSSGGEAGSDPASAPLGRYPELKDGKWQAQSPASRPLLPNELAERIDRTASQAQAAVERLVCTCRNFGPHKYREVDPECAVHAPASDPLTPAGNVDDVAGRSSVQTKTPSPADVSGSSPAMKSAPDWGAGPGPEPHHRKEFYPASEPEASDG